MKSLHNRVNIVPVIAKSDTLTKQEVNRLKKRVLDEIAKVKKKRFSKSVIDPFFSTISKSTNFQTSKTTKKKITRNRLEC